MSAGLASITAMTKLKAKKQLQAHLLSEKIRVKERDRLITNAKLGNWYQVIPKLSREYLEKWDLAKRRKMSRYGVVE